MAEQWYYSQQGQDKGPVSPQQLKQLASSGKLKADDIVWKEGMTARIRASQVKGLFAQSLAATPLQDEPPPIPADDEPPPIPNEDKPPPIPLNDLPPPIPVGLFAYYFQHFAATHWPAAFGICCGILAIPAVSLLKPVLGFRGLCFVLAGAVALSIASGILYTLGRFIAYYLGGQRAVSKRCRSLMAVLVYGGLMFVIPMAPWVAGEYFAPPYGLLASIVPQFRKEQAKWLHLPVISESEEQGRPEPLITEQPAIDLLEKIDPGRDTSKGEWKFEGKTLVSGDQPTCTVKLPYSPPDNYTLTAVVERKRGNRGLTLGLVVGSKACKLQISGEHDRGQHTSGIDKIDDVGYTKNATAVQGDVFEIAGPHVIECTVSKPLRDNVNIRVQVDGKKIIDWTGGPTRLSTGEERSLWLEKRDKTCVFAISKLELRLLGAEKHPTTANVARTMEQAAPRRTEGPTSNTVPAEIGGQAVNLLERIDLGRDTIQGTWSSEGTTLVSFNTHPWPILTIPYSPPEEYTLTAVVERKEGIGHFGIGLVVGSTACVARIDGGDSISGINFIDGEDGGKNETRCENQTLHLGTRYTIKYTVRKPLQDNVNVVVQVDGKKIIDWTGSPSRLSPSGSKGPHAITRAGKDRFLWLQSDKSSFAVSKLELRPIGAVAATTTVSNPSLPRGAILVTTFNNGTVFPKDGSVFVKDLSGRGNLGEIHGASFVRGKVGNALKFDGHDSVSVSGEYPSGASPRTLAAWIRCDEEQRDSLQVVVTYGESPHGRAFGIALWPKMGWGIHGHRADLATRLDADTQWHHHAITYDGVEGAYYIDGQEVKRGPLEYTDLQPPHAAQPTRPLDTASSPMVFGSNLPDDPQHASYFVGILDEVVVYDRVLTAEEIKSLYQMGLNGESLAEYR